MKKVGIVGLGNIFDKTKDILFNIPNFNITALCDISQERINAYKDSGLFLTTNYKELLGNCDAVMISTPPKSHYAIAKFFAQNGLDVIVEKPLTMEKEELTAFKQMHDGGANIYSMLHYSFGKEIVWWKEHGKSLGNPKKITAIFDDPYYANGKLDEHAVGLGGAYIDSTINLLSGVYRLFSGKLTPCGRKLKMDAKTNIDIYANSRYEIDMGKNKIDVDITVNWDCQKKNKQIFLYYQNRTIILDGHEQLVIDAGNNEILYRAQGVRMLNHYEGMLKEYVKVNDNFDFSYSLHSAILDNINQKTKGSREKLWK